MSHEGAWLGVNLQADYGHQHPSPWARPLPPGVSPRPCPRQGPHEAGREETTRRKPPGTRCRGWAFCRVVRVFHSWAPWFSSWVTPLPGTPRTFLKQEEVGSLGPLRSPLALPHQETPLPEGLFHPPMGRDREAGGTDSPKGPPPSPSSVCGPRPASQASVPPMCLHFLEKQVEGRLFMQNICY